ncbi:serine/threonine-protein phosphatase 4 regulatory subunit 1 [Electrophorus electricus]|uniref:serine/threonine-protein phosphatase 4 regulatory subunit 1 n=1 Tax=Electrophorus electricus TaxID=8005 RepID=UPI0015CFC07D|nr:serine/threonine-protein phosphatase 4 regulatory subunit 1 [Electrophorus electricus]
MVARSLLDTLKAVSEDERDCIAVLERVSRLADDSESTVRAELMEQIPHIAIFCQENRPSIPFAFSKYLLPIVVRYLADQNNLVRKTSQAALLMLLEQELIERTDIENLVCPVLVDLTAPDSNDDVKTEAMAIICKMSPMVGKDITERLFLSRFCEMCCDCRMFHVRKVCAANFGDICSVVGGEATEELLLPRFFQLCSDNVWGVRKACAECFMTVSSATSQEVRRTKLASLFINLISDPSRWVRQAAFQSLGQFISTFASPSTNVGQYFKEGTEDTNWNQQSHNQDGERAPRTTTHAADCSPTPSTEDSAKSLPQGETAVSHQQDCTFQNSPCTQEHCEGQLCRPARDAVDVAVEGGGEQVAEALPLDESCCGVDSDRPSSKCLLVPSDPDPDPTGEEYTFLPEASPAVQESFSLEIPVAENPTHSPEGTTVEVPEQSASVGSTDVTCTTLPRPEAVKVEIPEQELYNSFHYWRTPILQIDLDLELLEAKCNSSSEASVNSSCTQVSTPTLGRKQLEELIENLEPHIDDPDVKAQVDVLTAALRATSLDTHHDEAFLEPRQAQNNPYSSCHVPLIEASDVESQESTLPMSHVDESELSDSSMSPEDERKSKQQDVVPQVLLDQYLSMTDPSRAQTVDMEIAKHCAYSLPGVALTLGRQNWHCLRDTFETLASDMQWKVRRTLAFSIHELALILGDQLTAEDLVPIFNGFLKDLDEVRIGVLRHLYDFLKLLHQETRRKYLYQLQEFLVTDNSRNWRFRSELAEYDTLLCSDVICIKAVLLYKFVAFFYFLFFFLTDSWSYCWSCIVGRMCMIICGL